MNWLTLDRLTTSGYGELPQSMIPERVLQRMTVDSECEHHWRKYGHTPEGLQRYKCSKCPRMKFSMSARASRRELVIEQMMVPGATTPMVATRMGLWQKTVHRIVAGIPRPPCPCGRSGNHRGGCAPRKQLWQEVAICHRRPQPAVELRPLTAQRSPKVWAEMVRGLRQREREARRRKNAANLAANLRRPNGSR